MDTFEWRAALACFVVTSAVAAIIVDDGLIIIMCPTIELRSDCTFRVECSRYG